MTNTVFMARTQSYEEAAVQHSVDLLFEAIPAAKKLKPGVKVLLKPNLLAKHPPEHAVTTHPAVVRAVIRACKARGVEPENLILADSAGGVYNPAAIRAIYKASGLAQVCEEEGIEAYDGCEWVERKAENGVLMHSFNLLRPVAEADVIIDLPKLKTHVMTGVTAATKNLFGCIPGLQKAELHTRFPKKEHFGDMLVDLLQTVQPDFAILDGVLALEGDGPAGGEPRQVGIMMASENLLNLDLAVAGLAGLAPMRVPYLRAAHDRGLCGEAFNPADLGGHISLYSPIPDFRLPSSYRGKASGNTDFADAPQMPGVARGVVRRVEGLIAPHPVIDRKKCVGCGKCAEICPGHTIRVENRKAHISPDGCIRCFCCHEMCPAKAIKVRQLRLFKL